MELRAAIDDIWSAAGRERGTLARAFSFPVNSAGSVAKAFSKLSILFMSPEMDNGDIKTRKDDTVLLTLTSCPIVSCARTYGADETTVFSSSWAYNDTAINSLNPVYGIRNVKKELQGGFPVRVENCEKIGKFFSEKTIF
jgi:hypothetical protein